MIKASFASRHIGPDEREISKMLKKIGCNSIDTLIEETVPASIRLNSPLNLPEAVSEFQYLKDLKIIASKNKVFKSYIGLGYHNCITPGVILRTIFENPGWYTAYTPYQAEIAQGRLEALLNFQTMVLDLTGMEIANASLLDEGTAAGEAMQMLFNNRSKEAEKKGADLFFVSDACLPQTIDILKTRSAPLGIKLVIGNHETAALTNSFFGALLQYPAADGCIYSYKEFVEKAKSFGIQTAVAADLMSLVLLSSPGSWGADIVVGTSQRFGVPMGYGGPHAAFFAAKESYKRIMPGRIIGVSIDAQGNPALRMALQTREQHIRRDKATSNICTAQVLLAVIAGMYAVYHGPEGLKNIATSIHEHASHLAGRIENLGFTQLNPSYFDTLKISLEPSQQVALNESALKAGINFRYAADAVMISLDETTSEEDVMQITALFAALKKPVSNGKVNTSSAIPMNLRRNSPFMTQDVFNTYHSETNMLRYIKRLENKDLALNHSMIPLGSCTMKLNAASEMIPLSWPEFSSMHPFAPLDQAQGYQQIITELEQYLCEITGFAAISLQPNSGAQGEFAGLMVIREYHRSQGNDHRNVALIPVSAHGTNPASAAIAGMKIVLIKCDEKGNIDIEDLRTKAIQVKENLSCLMVTYPSTHGVYEEGIMEITKIIHENGGQVYMDGANMNAQVGLTSPGNIGADVCHLNLHKTFAIPHGGGGPGMGPIGVASHLAPFLPAHAVVNLNKATGISAVSAAPWGSASILLISYGYIKMLGKHGVTEATKMAILNANYIKESLKEHYNTLYVGKNGRCAHEMILDCSEFKRTAQVEVADIAKRLMDYGFHAPTVSFPVHDTIMVEPTESESLEELDRFCEAMKSIRNEIKEIEDGLFNKTENVLKNAPHTMDVATTDDWKHPYSRNKAVFPLAAVKNNKFWPSVGRIDNAYGDRNLICSCTPTEAYNEELVAN
jgi:glycine dehydrogenase